MIFAILLKKSKNNNEILDTLILKTVVLKGLESVYLTSCSLICHISLSHAYSILNTSYFPSHFLYHKKYLVHVLKYYTVGRMFCMYITCNFGVASVLVPHPEPKHSNCCFARVQKQMLNRKVYFSVVWVQEAFCIILHMAFSS